ncbi:acyltransferase family protein [Pseudomonas knackmussii]|uniref:acyltransferase family protein n=1 Tax=Pseudomonas knackmussii TaxID=65741 RepID=UPI001363F005|nr:acyltransferase [Pseudomonas knackmussii]
MLGTIRFLLSFCVIAFHLTAAIPNLGQLSVNCFYVISGFLISLVLNETYNFKIYPFAANRFLRLYPAYFAVAGLSAIFCITINGYAQFHTSWTESAGAKSILGNALMFPWAFFSDDVVPVNFIGADVLQSESPLFRLVPSTWSVGVEITCYFLLWLFSSRSLLAALSTVVVGSLWQVYVIKSGADPRLGYFPVPAALLPFGLGALAYHIARITKPRQLKDGHAVLFTLLLITAFSINWRISTTAGQIIGSVYYYTNDLLAFAGIILINRSKQRGSIGKLDKFLGDLAYPMFLGQYVFGFIAWKIIGTDNPIRSNQVFVLGSLITVIASIAVAKLVDRRLNNARNGIRTSAGQQPLAGNVV